MSGQFYVYILTNQARGATSSEGRKKGGGTKPRYTDYEGPSVMTQRV